MSLIELSINPVWLFERLRKEVDEVEGIEFILVLDFWASNCWPLKSSIKNKDTGNSLLNFAKIKKL